MPDWIHGREATRISGVEQSIWAKRAEDGLLEMRTEPYGTKTRRLFRRDQVVEVTRWVRETDEGRAYVSALKAEGGRRGAESRWGDYIGEPAKRKAAQDAERKRLREARKAERAMSNR